MPIGFTADYEHVGGRLRAATCIEVANNAPDFQLSVNHGRHIISRALSNGLLQRSFDLSDQSVICSSMRNSSATILLGAIDFGALSCTSRRRLVHMADKT
jgi:hypothetical protein